MHNIRLADKDDFDKVLEMGHKFFLTTEHAKTEEFHIDSAVDTYIQMLHSGFILVAELDEEVIGVIGCIISPFLIDKRKKVCTELLWWVEPEYRKSSVGPKLHRAAELKAKELGASKMVMVSLSTSPAEVEPYYLNDGYSKTESSFLKEL